MLTNTGLVEYVKRARDQKWGYVWGTYGQVLTPKVYAMKLEQYPDAVGKYGDFIENNWINRRTADCAGLIKGYLWDKNGEPVYNPTTDLSANAMFKNATDKSLIGNKIPEIPGLLLCMDGHIGVYIGNGQVIESKGTKYGVIQSPLSGPGANVWTHWMKCPYIQYEEPKDYKQLIMEVSIGRGKEWIEAIDKLVAESSTNNSIFRFLPTLIEQIGRKR